MKRLIFEETWGDKFDRLTIYFIFFAGAIMPFFVYYDPYKNNLQTGVEYYLLFVVTVFCAYVIYKKATEKNLDRMETRYEEDTNKKMLIDHFSKKGYEKQRNSNNILIFTKSTSDLNADYKKSRIFLFKGRKVYFTIIQDRFKLNLPILTLRSSLRKELVEIFNED